jgi:RHS repeat-associated protein
MLTMPTDGYFYTFLTNYSDTQVSFDNLTIHHKQGVLRAQYDYYPYGLAWGRQLPIDPAKAYNETYNSSEFNYNEWGDTGLDLNYFEARYYDPVLGRFHAPDPYQQFHSPYMANFDDPANHIDPDGRLSIDRETTKQVVGMILFEVGRVAAYCGLDGISGGAQFLANLGGIFSATSSLSGGGMAQLTQSKTVKNDTAQRQTPRKNQPFNVNPTAELSNKQRRNLAKFDKMESELCAQNGLAVGSQASRTAMDQAFGDERWYWSRADEARSARGQGTDDDHFYSVRKIADARDQFNAPAPVVPNGMVNVQMGAMQAQRDPITNRIEASIPIVASGTVQSSIQFAGGGFDQATIWIAQGQRLFDKTTPINGGGGDRLQGNNIAVNGPVNQINIANGGFLTIQISGPQLGAANNITYSILVNAGVIQNPPRAPVAIIQTTSLQGDANWKTRQRLSGKNRESLQKILLKGG